MRAEAGAPATLAGLAQVALYLLSVAAVGGASLAWHPPAASTAWQAGAALLLGAALVSGERGAALRSRVSHWVGGAAAAGPVAYVGAVALMLLSLYGPPTRDQLGSAAVGFGLVQCVLLALGGGSQHRSLTLLNVLVLCVLAGARGGGLATAAVASCAALLVAFLVLDHHARRLAWHRRGDSGLAGPVAAEAALRGLLVGVGLAGWLVLMPPAPLAGVRGADGALDRERWAELQARLAVIGIVGAGLVYAADRLRRRRKQREAPVVEQLLAERGGEEPLPLESRGRAVPGSEARRRIVSAYAGVLRAAAEAGLVRGPGSTADELEPQLAATRSAVRALTRLFSAARYGPAEPGENAVRSAEELAGLASRELSALRPTGRRQLG